MSRHLHIVDLGPRPYRETLALQRELCRARVAGETAEDLLLLVEHEPVVTLGRGTQAASLPLPRAELERRGLLVEYLDGEPARVRRCLQHERRHGADQNNLRNA